MATQIKRDEGMYHSSATAMNCQKKKKLFSNLMNI